MSKKKKLTYNELANYIVMTENKLVNAINVVGTTLTDFIEFNKKKQKKKKLSKQEKILRKLRRYIIKKYGAIK
jgi:UDP-N-acetylglucosamine 2-epimerase